MECPNTGEPCMYLTQFAKLEGLALLKRAAEENAEYEEMWSIIGRVFEQAKSTPERSQCDETYCAALGNAVVDALIYRGLKEFDIRKQARSQE